MMTDAVDFLKSTEILAILEMHAKLFRAQGMEPNWWGKSTSTTGALDFTFEDISVSCFWTYSMLNNCHNSWELQFFRDGSAYVRIDTADGLITGIKHIGQNTF